jgi:mono/diheme cytochrome c family protein
MRPFYVTALVLGIAAAVASCKHDPMPGPAASPGQGTADPEHPSFINDILPIFVANCSGCHNPTLANDGYVFTSYQTITAKKFTPGDPYETKLYEAITDDEEEDRMPQAPNPRLTADKILLIKNWIRNGAPNN